MAAILADGTASLHEQVHVPVFAAIVIASAAIAINAWQNAQAPTSTMRSFTTPGRNAPVGRI
jgi:hypothetical protein